MAGSIQIPIEIFTKDALAEIKKFTQTAEKNLKTLNESTKKQNEILEETNSNLKVLTSNEKALGIAISTVVATLALQSKNVKNLFSNFTGLNLEILKASKIFKNFGSGIKGATEVTGKLAKASVVLDKGIVGLSINLSTLSLALLGVGKLAESTENDFIGLIGRLSIFASLITGSLSIGLIYLIKSLAQVSFEIGTKLVDAAKKATDNFAQFDKKTFVFERTLQGFNRAFGESIGTVESWNETILDISNATGFTEKALRGAVTEIIATTSAMGFNEEQQKQLLAITTDYASFLGDDVIQTTIEFISALNGQAQSVQKYGVKLGQAQLQQKLYNKGINENLSTLTENEKIQIRYNSLLKQYEPIAGNATAVTGTLAGQQKVLNSNLTRLSQSFGKGAAVIENNNLVAAGLNLVLNNINDSVLSLTGFLTSLGGRLLQVGGIILGVSFNVLATIKVIKILNVLLETNLFQILTNTPIPIFNKSLLDLVRSSGAAYVSFKSLGDILKTFASIMISQTKIIIAGLAGVEVASLSLSSVLKGVFVQSFNLAKTAVGQFAKVLLTLLTNPIVAIITGIVGAIVALTKAIQFIEERTGAFSNVFSVLGEVLLETSSIFEPIVILFSNFGNIIKKLTKQIAGGFVAALSSVLSYALKLVQYNPFNIFSKEQVQKITNAKNNLDNLSGSLVDVDFDISKLKNNTTRSIASINENFKKIDLAPLLRLQEELKDVGLTDKQKLMRQRDERLAIIQDGLASEGKAYKIAKELEVKINKDYQKQISELNKQGNKESIEFIERIGSRFSELSADIEQSLGKVGTSIQSAFSFAFGTGSAKQRKELDQLEEDLEKAFAAGKLSPDAFEIEKSKLTKLRKQLSQNTTLALGTGILNSFAKGSQGATELVTGLSQLALDAFVPGLGQAAGPLLDVFAQGPEATKQAFNQFAQTVPTVIENIILSIPAAIEAIADNVDIIVYRLIDRLDDIIIALVKAMPKVSAALAVAFAIDVPIAMAKAAPGMAANLVKEIALVLPAKIFEGIKNAFNQALPFFKTLGKSIYEGLWDGIKGIGTFMSSLGKQIYEAFWSGLKTIGSHMRNFGKVMYLGFWDAIKNITVWIQRLGRLIYEGFWDGIKDIGNFFYDLGKSVANGIKDGISSLGGILGDTNVGGVDVGGALVGTIVGGNVGGFIGGIPDFSFAQGGMVPKGFPNDTFPARLTSGEFVIDRNLTSELGNFLASQNSQNGRGDVVEGLLAQLIGLMKKDQNIKTTVEFNENTLADIILNLSRNNARLA